MTKRRGVGTVLATAATAALIASGSAAPASAATALTISSLRCNDASNQFTCTLSISGGTAPYRTSWTGDWVTFDYTTTTYAEGSCYWPEWATTAPRVVATVTDSAGHSASASSRLPFNCRS